jgi:hypothetical protein
MYTKLTLSVEQGVIEDAKIYAKKTGYSISKLVEDFLRGIANSDSKKKINTDSLGTITSSLVGGIGFKGDADNLNYKDLLTEALSEKYL